MNIKKLTVALLLISLVVMACLFMANKETFNSSSEIIVEKTPTRLNLKQSKVIIPETAAVKSSFPDVCHSPLKDLAAMTADDYKSLAGNKEELIHFFGEKCFTELLANETVQKFATDFKCDLTLAKINETQCMGALFLLKAYSIADHSLGKSPQEMTPEELAANIAKMFFEMDKLNKENFKENIGLINALHELYPHDPDITEAYLGYMMIGRKITKDESVSDRISELLDQSEGESFKVDRLQVFKDILNDKHESTKATLDRLQEKYPREAELSYYYAAYYWKQGNREMANTFLDQAIGNSASCSYCVPDIYKDTKRRLAGAKKGDQNLFSLSIGLNFENL